MAGLLMLAGVLGYRIYSLQQQPASPAPQPPAPAAEAVTPQEPVAPPAPPPVATPAPVEPKAEPKPPAEPKRAAEPKQRKLSIPVEESEPPPKAPASESRTPIPVVPAPESRTSIPVVPAEEGRRRIPVVPAPETSSDDIPRPQVKILRPERSLPAPAASAPARQEPAASIPPSAPATPYRGPSAGTLIWSGQIKQNTLVTINGNQVSLGRLTGELPGVPVRIELETDAFAIVEAPSPANNWKRLSLRSLKSVQTAVVVKWIVQQ